MHIQEVSTDKSIEFIEDPEVALDKLEEIKTKLSDLADNHLPLMAYITLLDIAIANLRYGQNKMFYLPIPWEVATGLPSQPSLIADARHYCKINNLPEATGLTVDSFAEWRLLVKQKIFCCCGKNSVITGDRVVPIEVVIHHPIIINRKSHILEIKQLVGVKSTDRKHIENHYNLRRDSRVNSDISIIKTGFIKINLINFHVIAHGETSAEQFDLDYFKQIFTEMCHNATHRPV